MKEADAIQPYNALCWALGRYDARGRLMVRRVVWGRLLASYERRDGEAIVRAMVLVRKKKAKANRPTGS